MEKEFKIKSFNCEENLSQYISSMLFDSGEEIATGVFSYGDDELEVTLQVSGEVAVTFKDEVYHRPSDFPEELVQLIKEHPYDWDVCAPPEEEDDEYECYVYVGLNNWFEYIFDCEGSVYEDDLAEATPEMILEDMTYLARWYFELEE